MTKNPNTSKSATFCPLTDVVENSDGYQLLVDMPGVSNQGLEIKVERNVLTLIGNIEHPAFRSVGAEYTYRRSFELSDWVDQDKIQAVLSNGELVISLPKAERMREKNIPVRAA